MQYKVSKRNALGGAFVRSCLFGCGRPETKGGIKFYEDPECGAVDYLEYEYKAFINKKFICNVTGDMLFSNDDYYAAVRKVRREFYKRMIRIQNLIIRKGKRYPTKRKKAMVRKIIFEAALRDSDYAARIWR